VVTEWILLAAVLVALVAASAVLRSSMIVVPTGHVGLVFRKWGREDPQDRFEVRTHGGRGWQADLLKANVRYFRPPWLYRVKVRQMTKVPPGTIGVVVAHFGRSMPPDRQLALHVESENFSDARAFLLGGGEMGRQPRILTSGYHSINTFLFEVLTVNTIGDGMRHDLTADDLKDIAVPPDRTGVVTVHDGLPQISKEPIGPKVEGHASFQYVDRFLAAGGRIGTQAETLNSGGVYRINPWFAQISMMPTREITLHWGTSGPKSEDSYDAELGQIKILVDGVEFRFDMSQTLRVPPEAAPILVARLGDPDADAYGYTSSRKPTPIKRFVNGVLSHVVEGNLQAIAESYSAVKFYVSHAEVQAELETQVRHDLAEWGVDAGKTTLGTFAVDDPRLARALRDAAVAEQEGRVLEIRSGTVLTEEQIEIVRQRIERGRLRLRSVELEEQVRLLGRDAVAMEKFLAQLAKVRTPEYIGGGATEILNSLPLPLAMDMINKAFGRQKEKAVPSEEDPLGLETPEPDALDADGGTPEDPTDDS